MTLSPRARPPLRVEVSPQPTDTSCGPTCLHAVYRFFGDKISLGELVQQVPAVQGGGTLMVCLANHALRGGYQATLYTYNLRVFDPTWFPASARTLKRKLTAEARGRATFLPGVARGVEAHCAPSAGPIQLPLPWMCGWSYNSSSQTVLRGGLPWNRTRSEPEPRAFRQERMGLLTEDSRRNPGLRDWQVDREAHAGW